LHKFGFRLPQAYDEIHVATDLFDWDAERTRQQKLFTRWRRILPPTVRKLVATPRLLAPCTPTGSSTVQPPYPYGAIGSADATLPGVRGNYARH
jgi:hypothetical protein